VGDDDSGPEDALDDLDLECGSPPLRLQCENTVANQQQETACASLP
jgi:hypothetical protein